jgi:hypothetical protein
LRRPALPVAYSLNVLERLYEKWSRGGDPLL